MKGEAHRTAPEDHDVEAITGRCGLQHMNWNVEKRLPLVVLVAQALPEPIQATGQKGDLATLPSRVSIRTVFSDVWLHPRYGVAFFRIGFEN